MSGSVLTDARVRVNNDPGKGATGQLQVYNRNLNSTPWGNTTEGEFCRVQWLGRAGRGYLIHGAALVAMSNASEIANILARDAGNGARDRAVASDASPPSVSPPTRRSRSTATSR